MAKFNYIHREAANDNSMSSLHTPVSLIEYGLRREAFGEGMLVVTEEGLLSAGATQKYPKRQLAYLQRRKSFPSLKKRLDAIEFPNGKGKSGSGSGEGINTPPLTPSAAPLYPPSRWKDSLVPGNVGVSKKLKGANYGLHGNLGTGNPHSTYVFKAGNREDTVFSDTLVNRVEKRITNEERKTLRAYLSYALRRVKYLTSQARIRQYLSILENHFISHFHQNRMLKSEFFQCESFAIDLVTEIIDDVLVRQTPLKDRYFGRKRENALPTLPEIEDDIKRTMKLKEMEESMKTEMSNIKKTTVKGGSGSGENPYDPHATKLTDASQLTRGRLDYHRWDFDNAISAPPCSIEMKANFIDGFMDGRAALRKSIEDAIKEARNNGG